MYFYVQKMAKSGFWQQRHGMPFVTGAGEAVQVACPRREELSCSCLQGTRGPQ